ncbi:type II secretion system minor pseudopilin GspK [Ferrimonas lipolytica]|uniref:Type II secretion system protein K n=1 Tax=Ferrimonas lipolytica TaxID=2724191 RepID=A0A6H1UHW3_9GAMM|nr:type II secretion system minor pseudopilin GspK [Ferrimonas lipolytica]QIZ78418.1 type II secretion system minor pseudopilin GspK [Ferrimonas lipolytica]
MKKQRGVALLTVLLVLTVMVTIAAGMTNRSYLSARRSINLNNHEQAYWYAMASEALAKRALKQDFEDADGTVHLQQYWALADVVYPVENGTIAGTIDDMRSCFNLNALSLPLSDAEKQQDPYQSPLAVRQLVAMLEAYDVDSYTAEMIADRVRDFVDADSDNAGSYGAESAEYEAREFPYQAPNQLMFHHSELRAVLGVSAQHYQFLEDRICAIPGDDRQLLNVNTLAIEQPQLLVGMVEGKLSNSEAQEVLNNRPEDGWETIEDFWAEANMQRLSDIDDALKSTIVVDSDYFRLRGGAQVDTAVFRLETVLQRGGGDTLTVVSRQFGGQQ